MIIASLFILILVAIAGSLICQVEKRVRIMAGIFSTAVAGLIFYIVSPSFFGQSIQVGNWWLIDGFSAIMASLVAILYLTATWVSVRYIGHERHEGIVTDIDVKVYFALLHLFVMSMLVVVLTNHALILWLALEATTLSSTFLVGLYRKKTSIEAAWKYIVICSTGITLGLLGILMLGYGTHLVNELVQTSFLLSDLLSNASLIPDKLAKWAFVFIFVGFGAKVGYVPTHTWLPDAHSKAPSPISALFSGILLNVALYAIIRFQMITNKSLGGNEWTSSFFLIFGALSVLLPAFMMLIQKNYKRMLAYSSIEHMGLISLALSIPPIGTIAAVMHMTGHALVKSSLFFGAGEVLLLKKSTDTDKVRGLLKEAPFTAILFLLGILSIVAVPPSLLFVSEYMMLTAFIKTHLILTIILFAALGAIAYAMLRVTLGMLISENDNKSAVLEKEKWNSTQTIIALQLSMVAIMTIWFSAPIGQEFLQAVVKNII